MKRLGKIKRDQDIAWWDEFLEKQDKIVEEVRGNTLPTARPFDFPRWPVTPEDHEGRPSSPKTTEGGAEEASADVLAATARFLQRRELPEPYVGGYKSQARRERENAQLRDVNVGDMVVIRAAEGGFWVGKAAKVGTRDDFSQEELDTLPGGGSDLSAQELLVQFHWFSGSRRVKDPMATSYTPHFRVSVYCM